jgi:hypothetical protein
MNPETHLTQVTEEDLRFIEAELDSSPKPSSLRQLAEKLAYQKTASQRTQDIKKYDSRYVYDVGDQILKDYDEPLTVSSKTVEHFQGVVVLTVVGKTFDRAFQCEMLEVDYIGGGTFRRYIDYMKKSKAQVFLPSNTGQEGLAPERVAKQDDPRLTELPVTEKDLKTLERNLKTALLKSPVFFSWNDCWQLSRKQVDISEDKIKEAEALLQETGQPAGTAELIHKLYGLEPSAEAFDIHCLSLNTALDKKYKKEFVFVSPADWGRWHLKKVLNAMPANLPLTALAAKCPPLDKSQALEFSIVQSFPLKVYLTWREVLSGGIRVPRSIHKELSHAREYVFIDAEEGKNYPVYFFPNDSCFLGLAEFYAANNIPQGTSLTLERKDTTQFQFWIKKSKKKIAVPKLAYDAPSDTFTFSDGGEVFTYALPNKSIFIEHEALTGLLALIPQRDDLDLHSLLILIFKNYSQEPGTSSLHFLRAFHLVDLLKQTTQEDVERVLLHSSQFAKSEKKKGVFYYKAPLEAKPEEEKKREKKPAEKKVQEARLMAGEEEAESLPIGMIEEDFLRQGEGLEEEEVLQVVAVEAPEQAPAVEPMVPAPGRRIEKPRPPKAEPAVPPAKKEKPPKKKPKIETERVPRARKSVKRVIEEKIEIEESELEALSAIKEAESEAAEGPTAEGPAAEALPAAQKEAVQADASAETPSFGSLFAEKLKSALKIKPEDKDKNKEKTKKK